MLSFNHVFDISCHVVCLTFYLVLLSLLILLAQKTLFSARRLRSTFMSCFSHVLGQRSERKLQSQRTRVTLIVVIHFSALGMMAYFLYIQNNRFLFHEPKVQIKRVAKVGFALSIVCVVLGSYLATKARYCHSAIIQSGKSGKVFVHVQTVSK